MAELERRAEVLLAEEVKAQAVSRKHVNELMAWPGADQGISEDDVQDAGHGVKGTAVKAEANIIAWTDGKWVFDGSQGKAVFKAGKNNEVLHLVSASPKALAAASTKSIYLWRTNERDNLRVKHVAFARQLAWNDTGTILFIMQDHVVLVWRIASVNGVQEGNVPELERIETQGPSLKALCWHAGHLVLGNALGQITVIKNISAKPYAPDSAISLKWKHVPHDGAICSLIGSPGGILALCGNDTVEQVRESIQIASQTSRSSHSFGLKDALFVPSIPSTQQDPVIGANSSGTSGGVLGSLLNISAAKEQEQTKQTMSKMRHIVHVLISEDGNLTFETLSSCKGAILVSGLCPKTSQYAAGFQDRVEVYVKGTKGLLAKIPLLNEATCRGIKFITDKSNGRHKEQSQVHLLLDLPSQAQTSTISSSINSLKGEQGAGDMPETGTPAAEKVAKSATGKFFFCNLNRPKKLVLWVYDSPTSPGSSSTGPLDLTALRFTSKSSSSAGFSSTLRAALDLPPQQQSDGSDYPGDAEADKKTIMLEGGAALSNQRDLHTTGTSKEATAEDEREARQMLALKELEERFNSRMDRIEAKLDHLISLSLRSSAPVKLNYMT